MRRVLLATLFLVTVILIPVATEKRQLNFTLSNAISAIASDVTGVIEGAGLLFPTPEELLQLPYGVLVGLPSKVVFSLLNNVCKLVQATDNIQPAYLPDNNRLNLVLVNDCNNVTVPLVKAEDLWNHPLFDRNKPVVLVVSGWATSINQSDLITAASKAFNCRKDHNFVAFDASYFLDTIYTWAALDTRQMGYEIAVALSKLDNITLIEDVHLIGHSLGAQIIGYAARFVMDLTGLRLKHITGLDPAKPCFNEGHTLIPIEKGIADFVEIVHSSPGAIGIIEALGDLDFYPNGYATFQPGCIEYTCTHFRSVYYYLETVYPNNSNDFLAAECTTLFELENGLCKGPKYPMGFQVPRNLRGKYFTTVNPEEPYGKNAGPNYQSSHGECGKC